MLATLLITMGNASQDPASVARKATIAWISVRATISTARTAAVRTGSGSRRRRAGSSTHNGRYPCPARPRSPASRRTPGPAAGILRSGARGPRRAPGRTVPLSSGASRRPTVPITVSLPTAGQTASPVPKDPTPLWLPGSHRFTPHGRGMRPPWPIPPPSPEQ
ncbi:hypothetical protein GCM10018772_48720 [Streptomyces fumanus]|uniref:Uncharacterized protein n=1 Tax=Streptomyces fumanus TaxID=67302 RepID=A0A919E6Q9_9ACTN|nr:hypothetical protein GCM10018772_48720 [Streptomyces fumanus]